MLHKAQPIPPVFWQAFTGRMHQVLHIACKYSVTHVDGPIVPRADGDYY